MNEVRIGAGDLKHKIRIQYKTTGKDSDGFPAEVWRDLGSSTPEQKKLRWAKWQWLHGNEFWQAQAVQSKAVAEATIRYVPGVLPSMRVLFKDKPYNILPPIDNILEKNEYIVFKVETVEGG